MPDEGFVDHIAAAADDIVSAGVHVATADALLLGAGNALLTAGALDLAADFLGHEPGTAGAPVAMHLDAAAGAAATAVDEYLAAGQAHANAAHESLFGSATPPPP